MKQIVNAVNYKLAGEVIQADENVIVTQLIKKDVPVEDRIDLQEFLSDIEGFCEANMNKTISLTFSLKVTEE